MNTASTYPTAELLTVAGRLYPVVIHWTLTKRIFPIEIGYFAIRKLYMAAGHDMAARKKITGLDSSCFLKHHYPKDYSWILQNVKNDFVNGPHLV